MKRTPELQTDVGPEAFRLPPRTAHDPVRTFHPRWSALGSDRRAALSGLWPTFGFSLDGPPPRPPLRRDGTLDTHALFGRDAPVVLEIGSGMGDATAAMAATDASRDYLAVETHLPGVANLLVLIGDLGVTNVRVCHGDALALCRAAIAPGSLAAVHVFFPDPWPKARHRKRRLIQPDHVGLLASRLAPGGALRCATDWRPYAESMLATIAGDDVLVNPHPGYAPRPQDRPVTKFEQRARAAGRAVYEIVGHRPG